MKRRDATDGTAARGSGSPGAAVDGRGSEGAAVGQRSGDGRAARKRRAYEPPRLVRVDLAGMASLDLTERAPVLAGAPSSPNISGATAFAGRPPPREPLR